MTTTTAYKYLHERKRTWTPVAVSAGQLLSGGEEAVKRGLALRGLEIPVGDFISDAMKRDLPESESVRQLLLSNVEDEIRHDQALNFAAMAHQIPTRFEAEAQRITQAWVDLDCHPILKAVVLETFCLLCPPPALQIPWRHWA